MPIYSYRHPTNGKVVEVKQTMTEEHCYTDSHGVKWLRVFDSPQASVKDEKLDLNSPKDIKKYKEVYKKRFNHKYKKK